MNLLFLLIPLCSLATATSQSSKPKSWRDFDVNKDNKLSHEERQAMNKAWGIKPANQKKASSSWLHVYNPPPAGKKEKSSVVGPTCGRDSTSLSLPPQKTKKK